MVFVRFLHIIVANMCTERKLEAPNVVHLAQQQLLFSNCLIQQHYWVDQEFNTIL